MEKLKRKIIGIGLSPADILELPFDLVLSFSVYFISPFYISPA
jgi:hypothetical protein